MAARLRVGFACLAAWLACGSARLSRSKAVGDAAQSAAAGQSPCGEPVRRARVKFPQSLVVGDVSDLVMYSGYVNVTDRDFLFYWLAEAQAGVPADAPIVVWSNGGPGCSAMEGATTEHGPLWLFDVKQDGSLFAGKLSRNPYSWSKMAHMLYVDQPRYVGFSFGSGPRLTSSVQSGLDMVAFLRGWRLQFPEHAHRRLILASESYGGHYVPAWAEALLNYNERASDPFVLAGLLIGNGIVNETVQRGTMPEFARRQGLLPPDRTPGSDWEAREAMEDYLGYIPNYYDYRVAEVQCCGCSSYNYKGWSDWLLRADVAEALHVCGDAGFEAFNGCAAGCVDLPGFDMGDTFAYSAALGRALHLGIPVTLYYGMQDTACNYVGGYAMASSLPWRGAKAFNQAPFKDLTLGGLPVGKMKSVEGLTWIQVDAAGHMVPADNPAAAAFAVGTLVHRRHASPLPAAASLDVLGKAADLPAEAHGWLWSSKETSPSHRAQDLPVLFSGTFLCLSIIVLGVFRVYRHRLRGHLVDHPIEAEAEDGGTWPSFLEVHGPDEQQYARPATAAVWCQVARTPSQ